jgi:hypothetical protein
MTLKLVDYEVHIQVTLLLVEAVVLKLVVEQGEEYKFVSAFVVQVEGDLYKLLEVQVDTSFL